MAKTKAATPTIAFVTMCKGRLHHLRETLPTMAAQQPDELIVVDYSCPDGAGDWVEAEFPQARVVRVPGQDGFNASAARNAGAAAASSEWLFFVDADVQCLPGLADWLRANIAAGKFYRPEPLPGEATHKAWGSFACTAADFAAVGGYDEVMVGWGMEDTELYLRLAGHGSRESLYPGDLVVPFEHGDEERYVAEGLSDRWHNHTVNACYSRAKHQIARFRGVKDLPVADRAQLMAYTRKTISDWYAKGANGALPVRYIVAQQQPQPISRGTALGTQWTFTVLVQRPGPAPRR